METQNKLNHSIKISELKYIMIFFKQHLQTHKLSQAETWWDAAGNMDIQNS